MKYKSGLNTTTINNSSSCFVEKYGMDDKDLDGAIITIAGRYPDTGHTLNEISKELVYIINGKGKVTVNGELQEFSAGDLVIIDANEKFFWEGHFTMLVVCTPPFDPKQHKEIK